MTRSAPIAILSLALLAAPASAQWPAGQPAGVATKLGRTADGKPDLSGVWEPEKNRPCPPEGCRDLHTGEQFFDIGWGIKGGVPYTPWSLDLMKERIAKGNTIDPGTHCLPTGIVRMHTYPLLRKIVQVPGLVVILNERNSLFRQIPTDGRPPLPKEVELPTVAGYSTGKWDGDALVVESTGFTDDVWLDQRGSPLTSNGKLTERFRRPTFGKLEIEITIDDPKAYTAPWTVKLNQFLVEDTELLDYTCLENEKDLQNLVAK